MKVFFRTAVLWLFLLLFSGCAGKRPGIWMAESHLALGKPAACDQIIDRSAYTLGYSYDKRQALWVSYVLKKEDLTHGRKRSDIFKSDPLVISCPVSPDEYKFTGFDRGHLAPAADMVRNKKVMDESFYMSNISPQFPECNRKHWLKVEKMVRSAARREGMICIITGPYFSGSGKSISSPPIPVPDGFFKAVMDLTAPYKMIAFYVPNIVRNGKMQILSVRELEKLTGYDFFSELDDRTEYQLENSVDILAWGWENER